MNSQPNKLPSAFQTLTNPVKCTISAINQQSTSSNTFCGYKSKFNINEQKKAYEQQREHTQKQPNFYQNHQAQREQATEVNFESLWCALCERSFKNPQQLNRHVSEHEKCCFEGCLFEGHSSLLKKHIEMQHNSGLFSRITKIETDEDIEKWKEERRKRYPTIANVEARKLAQEQRMKRGERLEEQKSRFGKVNDRQRAQEFTPQNKNETNAANKKKPRRQRNRKNKNSSQNDKQSQETNETEEITEQKIEEELPVTNEIVKENENVIVNPLTTLLGAYDTASSDEEEEEKQSADAVNVVVASTSQEIAEEPVRSEIPIVESESEDDEPPEEQQIERITEEPPVDSISNRKRSPDKSSDRPRPAKRAKKPTILDMTRKIRNQNSLLEKLLQKDIRHERNVLLQCVRYVVKNNFFGVGQNKMK